MKPDFVCGTSIGALVGAIYASGQLDALEHWVTSLAWSQVVRLMDITWRGGLIRGQRLFNLFRSTFEDRDIAELDTRFGCVATELSSGREIWIQHGSLLDAARASIAMPGLFTPVVRNGTVLVDGGLVNPVPVSMCRAFGAEIVIAVDLSWGKLGPYRNMGRDLPAATAPGWLGRWLGNGKANAGRGDADRRKSDEPPIPSIFEVFNTALDIVEQRVARSRLAGEPADVLITPLLPDFGTMEYHRGGEAIAEGRAAVERMLPLIEQVVR